jgi:hypothetical protein
VNHAHTTVTHQFERAALDANRSEDAFRKEAASEIARLTAERLRAYRRVRLIGLLENAAHATPPDQDKVQAQRRRLCQEFGWSGDDAAHIEVLDQLEPVCRAIHGSGPDSGHGSGQGSGPAPEPHPVHAHLHAFEGWFLAARKTSFYALFDQYVQETPVVDF